MLDASQTQAAESHTRSVAQKSHAFYFFCRELQRQCLVSKWAKQNLSLLIFVTVKHRQSGGKCHFYWLLANGGWFTPTPCRLLRDFYIGAQLLRAQHSNQSHTGQISRVFSKWQFVLIKFWFFLFLIEPWKRWSKMSKQCNNFVYFLAFLWILPFNKVTLLILCICATLHTTYSALPFMPWNFSFIQCWPFFSNIYIQSHFQKHTSSFGQIAHSEDTHSRAHTPPLCPHLQPHTVS